MSAFICQSCGLTNDAGAVHCTECGLTTEILNHQPLTNKVDPFQELPILRNFRGWGIYVITSLIIIILVILSESIFVIILFSTLQRIPYVFYIIQNFADHKKLLNTTHGYHLQSPNPKHMGVLYFFLPIIPMFIKYRELRTHLRKDHQGEVVNPSSPYFIVGLLYIFPILYYFTLYRIGLIFIAFSYIFIILSIFGPTIIIFSYRLFAEYKWQKSMNQHIQNHLNFLSK